MCCGSCSCNLSTSNIIPCCRTGNYLNAVYMWLSLVQVLGAYEQQSSAFGHIGLCMYVYDCLKIFFYNSTYSMSVVCYN